MPAGTPWDRLDALARESLQAALRKAATKLGGGVEVSLLFCDDARMRELNRDFRGKDKPTNVLSFPGPDLPEPRACARRHRARLTRPSSREAAEQGKSLRASLPVT